MRAAGELRLRLADLLGEQIARGVTAATFHSICARMLREHASVFGRTENYTVYDQTDVRRVIEWLLSDQQRGQIQQALADYGQPAAAEVLAEISLAKNRLLSPDSYQQQARHTAAPLIAAVWREAEIELQRSNAWDFDDLLTHAVRLLAEHPHRLAFYRQRWKWLVVDEYQDTNEAQSVLVALLAGAGGNVCCVGDDDQLLYSFRAAEPRNMLCFGERFPAHARIVLGRNFRSRSEILEPAAALHRAQRAAAREGADRDARRRRRGASRRVRVGPPRGRQRRRGDRAGARPGRARGRGARARPHRLRHRAGAGRARPRRDPAPGARQPRPLRALRGPRRARLPHAARQPRRRPGIPPRRRLTEARRRHRNRQPRRRARPRHTPAAT